MVATPTRTQGLITSWIEVVHLHPDVTSETFSEDIFALDLGALAEGSKQVPTVYREPEHFFRVSYLTKGLSSLLEDVLSRLSGGSGNRILKLLTPFGGGKSHTLASLYHAARKREALDIIPDARGFARPGKVRTAVFDGQFFDATNGKQVPGENFRARTMWGWIAWSLGGREGYEILRAQDEARVAPGADEILRLLATGPNLILLDEVLEYLISVGGVKVLQTTLRDETASFLKRLTAAVGNTTNSVLVFSLQSSKRESLEYVNLLHTIDHLASRKDQLREPVELDEVLLVVQRRLLSKLPTPEQSEPAANAYQNVVTQMRRAYARGKGEEQQAEEEGLRLRSRVQSAYPFHPALIDVMREQWAAIPDFQRTRGALRFLAACLRAVDRERKSRILLGPGDVPMHDAEVRLAFFKEVGQQSDFQAVLEHDLTGVNARARRIDERRAKENPAEKGKNYATRLATAILMYSFGGRRREGGDPAETLPPGITESELLSVCVGPDFDSTTAQACLKELRDNCLYLHFDRVRYCFKKDANVRLLIEQESDAVARDDKQILERMRQMVEERVGSSKEANARDSVVWPKGPDKIDDRQPAFVVAYLGPEFAGITLSEQEVLARNFLEKSGVGPRRYKNGLALAIPSADQVEGFRQAVKTLVAIERVQEKGRQYNLTDDQKDELKERHQTEAQMAESVLTKLYMEAWLPKQGTAGIALDSVSVSGRPLQITLDEKKRARIHDRMMELLRDVKKSLFASVHPNKIIELFKLGEGEPPKLGIRAADVLDGFYSFLGFPRIVTGAVLKKAIAKGVEDRVFGYYPGSTPTLGLDGKFQVPEERVRRTNIAEEEIDFESGFLMLPAAIPVSQPIMHPTEGQGATTGGDFGPPQPPGPDGRSESGPQPPMGTQSQTHVELRFAVDRNQLFGAWNALANLADMAGKINVSVTADQPSGFDKGKLQNGVLEPLREADLLE